MTLTTNPGGAEPPGLPTFAELLAAYADTEGVPPMPPSVSLSSVLAGGPDPMGVVAYLGTIGIQVRQLDDLTTINSDPDEEELHAFRCADGIALSIASDGLWILFTP